MWPRKIRTEMYPVGWTIWKSLETSLGSCSRLAGTGPECQLSGKGQSYPQTMALLPSSGQIERKEGRKEGWGGGGGGGGGAGEGRVGGGLREA